MKVKHWYKIFFILGTFFLFLGIYLYIKPFLCKINKEGIDKKSLYCLINKARFKNKLQLLTINPKLEKAAELRAFDIVFHNQFTHKPISGRDMKEAIIESGYEYKEIGENLARGFDNNKDLGKAWMESASHSANILDNKFKDVGITIMDNQEKNAKIIVGLFGNLK